MDKKDRTITSVPKIIQANGIYFIQITYDLPFPRDVSLNLIAQFSIMSELKINLKFLFWRITFFFSPCPIYGSVVVTQGQTIFPKTEIFYFRSQMSCPKNLSKKSPMVFLIYELNHSPHGSSYVYITFKCYKSTSFVFEWKK